MDRCDCDEKYRTSGLNSAKQKGATSAEYVSYIHRDLCLNSRLRTVACRAGKKEHLAAGVISTEACWRDSGGKNSGGGVSCLAEGPVLKLCVPLFCRPGRLLLPKTAGQVTDCTSQLV